MDRAARPEMYTHDDLSDHAKGLVDEAMTGVKSDNASALSAARKLIAIAAGEGVAMFTVAELRGLSFVYAHVSPPESRSTIESYAARAYQDVIVTQSRLAELAMTETPLMRNNVEPAIQKAVAHALVHFEASKHDDAPQDDNDPKAAATMSDHAPTIGGFQQKPVDPSAAADASTEVQRARDESDKSDKPQEPPTPSTPDPKESPKSASALISSEPEPKPGLKPETAGVSYHDVAERPAPGAATPISGSFAAQGPAGLSTGDDRLP